MCMFSAGCFPLRTYVAQELVNGVFKWSKARSMCYKPCHDDGFFFQIGCGRDVK